MILRLLADESMYGYQMVKELQARSEGYFEMEQGTLYPALHRLERDGLVRSEWQIIGEGSPRKYYNITDEGRALEARVTAELNSEVYERIPLEGPELEQVTELLGELRARGGEFDVERSAAVIADLDGTRTG